MFLPIGGRHTTIFELIRLHMRPLVVVLEAFFYVRLGIYQTAKQILTKFSIYVPTYEWTAHTDF